MGEMGLIFGPVTSRRLGLSLGVDLVPFKTCSYGCIYCQLGRTTCLTLERRQYVRGEDAIAAVRRALEGGAKPDYITLSGSGEPTLHSGIGEVIGGIRRFTDIPIAVLTNGSLLWMPEVRRDLAGASVVLPTLAAGDEEVFRTIHRPPAGLTLERVVEGMIAFRREYSGPIWLEVFLIAGVNTSPEQIEKMRGIATRIAPDRIQLNTAVRPPSEKYVRALTPEEMERIRLAFGERAETIADFDKHREGGRREARADDVLASVLRHPGTAEDVAAGLGIAPSDAARLLAQLQAEGLVEAENRNGKEYFRGATR